MRKFHIHKGIKSNESNKSKESYESYGSLDKDAILLKLISLILYTSAVLDSV